MLHPEFEILSGDDDDGEAGAAHRPHRAHLRGRRQAHHPRPPHLDAPHPASQLGPEPDYLPEHIRAPPAACPTAGPPSATTHFPPPDSDLRLLNAFRSPRAVPPDLRGVLLAGMRRRAEARQGPHAPRHRVSRLNDRVRERVKAMLPFKPTGAQKRVLKEIADDMTEPRPMNRLLQGDVGSGKTIVAAEAAVIAIENGYQVAVLAPTEILATQHDFYFKQHPPASSATSRSCSPDPSPAARRCSSRSWSPRAWCTSWSARTRCSKRTSSSSSSASPSSTSSIASASCSGSAWCRRASHPDVLVMTATPIPRTLAMTLYGDLDVSVIDELPPGRKPIVTKHYTADRIEQVYSFMKKQIDEGRQAYVVYPVIEESETQAMKAAQKMYEHLSREVFPGYRGRPDARPARLRRKGVGDAALQGRRDQDPGFDHGDRGRRGRAERDRDGGRAGRALRPGAAAPASRACRPRRGAELLHPGDRKDERHRAGAHPHAGRIDRRLLHLRDGPEAARPRRVLRHQAIGPADAAHRQHPARPRDPGGRPARGGRLRRAIRPRRTSCAAPSPTSATTGSAATAW